VKLQDLIEVSKLPICSVFSVHSVVLKKSQMMERGIIEPYLRVFICIFHKIDNCRTMPLMNPPSRQTLDTLADTFKALAHPARLAIVYALAEGPLCACDLSGIAASSASTTSRHLTVLRHAGIISNSRKGQQIFYQLERPCILTFMDCCST